MHVAEYFVLMIKSASHLPLEVVHELLCLLCCICLEILKELSGKISVLGEEVVEVAHLLLPEETLLFDIILHVSGFIVYLFEYFLLPSYPLLLLLNQAILDALNLCSNRVQMIVMVLYPVLSLLIYHFLKVIHSLMVSLPLLSDELPFFIYLLFEVIPKDIKSVNEVLLKGVQSTVHKVHLLHRVLTVSCDFTNKEINEI